MLSRRLIAAASVFAVAAGLAFAEPTPPTKATPPSKVGGKTLKDWIEDLGRNDPGVRETAIRAIPYFRESAHSAARQLCTLASSSPDVPCRVQACLSLSYIASYLSDDEAAATVKVLIGKAESDTQAIVRLHAVMALGAFGNKAVSATDVLGRRAHDPFSWELRQAALYSLASVAANKKFGPEKKAVMPVVRLLDPAPGANPERSSQVRLAAVMTLREMGVPTDKEAYASAVEALEKATTRDHDKSVAIWASVTLIAYTGKGSDERLNEVTGHLKGKDVAAKLSAAAALGTALKSMDDATVVKKRLPDIVKLLDDKDLVVQAAAIEVLTGFGKASEEAAPRLEEIMKKKDQNEYFRQACALALEKITGKKPLLPPAPKNDTGSATSGTKPQIPNEIEGKTLEQWIKEIKDHSDHSDPSVQETAIRVMPYFGSAAARKAGPALVSRLKETNNDIACRSHAILSLAALAEEINGEDAAEAVRAISAVVHSSNQAILRYHAAVALGTFGNKATEAIPDLINLMHDPQSWEARQAAVFSLSNVAGSDKVGPDGRAVVAISTRLLNAEEGSAQVRMAMVMALGSMGRPNNVRDLNSAISALRHATLDRDKSVVIWAMVALMAVDKVTDKGLNDVASFLKGKDVSAKMTALRALGAMGREARPKIGDIADQLKDSDPLVLGTVLDVLAGLGSHANAAVPKIKDFGENIDTDKQHKDLSKDQREYFKDAAKKTIELIEAAPKKK